jgi:hypothetical protein
MAKRFLDSFRLVGVIVMLLLLCLPVLADSYSYYVPITFFNNSANVYGAVSLIASINNTQLQSVGYLSASGLNSNVAEGSTGRAFVLSDNRVAVFSTGFSSSQTRLYSYELSYSPSGSNFPVVVGYTGFLTTPYNVALEPGAGFELDVLGYVNTSYSSGKYILNKSGAIVIQVTNNQEITLTVYDGTGHTIILTGVPSGIYNISVTLAYGTLTFTVGSYTGSLTAAVGSITNTGGAWIWDEGGVMPYISSIRILN